MSARGDFLPELFPTLTDPFFQLIGVSADELRKKSGPATRIFRTATPPPRRHSLRLGFLSIPQLLPMVEGRPLHRSAPSPALLRGRHRRFPRFKNRGSRFSPAPHRPRGPIGAGIEPRRLGESCSPSRFPPFPAVGCSSSAFPPMSYLEIRVRGPEFSKRPSPLLAHSRRSGLFRASDRWIGRRRVPTLGSHRPPPSSVGSIGASPDSRIGGGRFSPAPHRHQDRWGADSGDAHSERSTLRVLKGSPAKPSSAASVNLPMPPGLEAGLLTPPPPPPERPRTAMGAPIFVLGRSERPPPPPSPPPPTPGGGMGGDRSSPRVCRPPDRWIRETRGEAHYGGGPYPATPIGRRPSPPALPIL